MHITTHLDVEVVAVESDDTVTVLLDLTAPVGEADDRRPAQAVVVVLDRSGSMSGQRLHCAQDALVALVDRLDLRDSFGLVTFDDEAQVVVPATPMELFGREQIRDRIASVQPGGMTDISSGYLRGLQEARRALCDGGATIILLSDGHANAGILDPQQFRAMGAKAASQAITTSSIGIGIGYDNQILSEVAIGGTGNHSFAEEAEAAATAVAAEIDGLLSKTVQAASLFITPSQDVASIGVLNDLPSQAVPGGILVELGDFYSGEQRQLLFTVGVPAMAGLGLAQVAQFELQFVAVPSLESHSVSLPISVNVVPSDVAKGRVPDPEVSRHRLLLDVQQAKRDSERALRSGDLDAAKDSLSQARQSLQEAPGVIDQETAGEIRFLDEAVTGLEARGAPISEAEIAMKQGSFISSSRAKMSRGHRRKQGGRADPTAPPRARPGPDEPDVSSDEQGGS